MSRNISLPSLSPSKDVSDYPLFTTPVSRWMWRIYAQRFTSAGRWFVLVSAIFGMYGGISLTLQGYVLASYSGVIWFVAAAGMLLYKPRVTLTARVGGHATAGESIPCDIEVTQLGLGRGADLVVVPHRLPRAIDCVPEDGVALSDLKRGQSVRVPMLLKCRARGEFVLRGFRVESGFPFGLLRSWRTFWQARRLLVYPRFHPLTSLALPSGRRHQPGGVAMVSHLGESFEYLGNREYREGDNVRDIDWRATARSDRPIVREWVEEYMLRAAVILDTHVPSDLRRNAIDARRECFERAISMSAAVSDYMARHDYLVDLFAAGPDLFHLTAGRSLAYLDQILEILCCVKESPTEPLTTIEPQLAELLGRLSTTICVFLDWTDARRAFALRLRDEGIAVKVIIVRDQPCTLDPAGDSRAFGEITVLTSGEIDRGVRDL